MGLEGLLRGGFVPNDVELSTQPADAQLLKEGRHAKLLTNYLPLICK